MLETKQEAGHYFKVKFDWLNVNGENIDYQTIDSGYLKDWNLLGIEGEEPVAQEEQKAPDPKAKGKAPAKPDPKKGGALEEITDNRPRTVNFTKDFGAENVTLRVTEDLAKFMASAYMKIDLIEVNREKPDEEVLQ